MGYRPVLLVISDYPIVAATAERVFHETHRAVVQSWSDYLAGPSPDAQLVIADVTSMDLEIALSLLRRSSPNARIAVCSLHQNEIKVFRTDSEGIVPEAELPSLLALTA